MAGTPATTKDLANLLGEDFSNLSFQPNAASGGGTLFSGSGVPAAGLGANGDFYFRTDTPGTLAQRIYIKSGGSWVNALA